MARGKRYDDRVKAPALAALAMGDSISKVARDFQLPKGTVSNWAREVHQVGPQKEGDQLGDLTGQYLEKGLESLTAQAEHFSDPEWLRQQSARSMALLHGVMFDKMFRVLTALEPVDREPIPLPA